MVIGGERYSMSAKSVGMKRRKWRWRHCGAAGPTRVCLHRCWNGGTCKGPVGITRESDRPCQRPYVSPPTEAEANYYGHSPGRPPFCRRDFHQTASTKLGTKHPRSTSPKKKPPGEGPGGWACGELHDLFIAGIRHPWRGREATLTGDASIGGST